MFYIKKKKNFRLGITGLVHIFIKKLRLNQKQYHPSCGLCVITFTFYPCKPVELSWLWKTSVHATRGCKADHYTQNVSPTNASFYLC